MGQMGDWWMMGRWWTCLGVLLMGGGCFLPGRAWGAVPEDYLAVMTVDTVECMVARADRIYVVKVAGATTTAPTGSTTAAAELEVVKDPRATRSSGAPQWIAVSVVETIKGAGAGRLGPFSVPDGSMAVDPAGAISSGEMEPRRLLLLDDAAGKGRLLNLEQETPWGVMMDGRVLKTGTELVAATRAVRPQTAMRYGVVPMSVHGASFEYTYFRASLGPVRANLFTAPATDTATNARGTASAGDSAAESTSSGLVRVPIDARLESLAHVWIRSRDRNWQTSGMGALGYFPSEENAALVRPFLRDMEASADPSEPGVVGPGSAGEFPAPAVISGVSPWTGAHYYPLRAAAGAALHRMGLPARDATVTEGPFLYYRWGWGFAVILVVGAAAVWLMLGRIKLLRPRGTRLAAAALVAALALTGLMAHSFVRDHLAGITVGSTYHDVAIRRGQVRYERLEDFPYSCALSYACLMSGDFGGDFDGATIPERAGYIPWHRYEEKAELVMCEGSTIAGLKGLSFGPIGGGDLAGPWAARVITLPLWPAPVVLALPGVAVFSVMGWRGVRRRRRGRRGLCLDCGYDLRAHAAGQRCPECGGVKG